MLRTRSQKELADTSSKSVVTAGYRVVGASRPCFLAAPLEVDAPDQLGVSWIGHLYVRYDR